MFKKEKKEAPKKDRKQQQPVHFIEDLERRQNASGPITTLAIGEEGGGGWW